MKSKKLFTRFFSQKTLRIKVIRKYSDTFPVIYKIIYNLKISNTTNLRYVFNPLNQIFLFRKYVKDWLKMELCR